jgi:hypothetical protein
MFRSGQSVLTGSRSGNIRGRAQNFLMSSYLGPSLHPEGDGFQILLRIQIALVVLTEKIARLEWFSGPMVLFHENRILWFTFVNRYGSISLDQGAYGSTSRRWFY